ncbi:hypothetical protein [Microbacterium aurantiacum]|uniref:hypothetical protein n=1 Tax=Microbacterium aurantiacum TaxID=162393 RepID=UPI003439F5B8
MPKPSRKPAKWAVIAFAMLGIALLIYASLVFVTQTPAELGEVSTGRGVSLPQWGWALLSIVLGVMALVFAFWAGRWRKRW